MSTSATSSTSSASIYAALNGTSSSSSKSSSTTSSDDIQSQFMTMLVTQLQNQDPLSPMDSSAMTSQLAQISTVSGLEKVNSTLETLLTSYDSTQSMQAAALLGSNVLVPGSGLTLSESQAVGGFEVASAADSVVLTIKDSNGNVVNTVDFGAAKAGSHLFAWDGTDASGARVADGTYTVTVTATQGGSSVTSTALQLGQVSAVVRTSDGYQLDVGTGTLVDYDDVRQVL